MVLLPNYQQAFIAIEKLRDYCLNSFHPIGKDEAVVFESALNFTSQDIYLLQDAIHRGLSRSEAIPGKKDQYGKRYTVDVKIRNLDREAIVRTGWIIKKDEGFPRLTTCYIK